MSISSNNILNNSSRNLLRDEEEDEEHGENKSLIDDDDEEEVFSTTSVRVLLVDADPNSLLAMTNLLTNFSYQVTSYENGGEAMSFLKTNKDQIDLVIWDYHMPVINGLEALNTIVKEIDLPVVITSHNHEIETVKNSILCGAYDFLVKPLSKEVVVVLWRHVYRKRIMSKPVVNSYSAESDPEYLGEEGSKDSLELNNSDQNGDKSSSKKPRMQWTDKLHKYFLEAIEKLGNIENAVPKQILKTMQEKYGEEVSHLTRNNVASHLQKHRQNVMKNPNNVQQENGLEHHWNDAGPNVTLTPSTPLQNPSLEFDTRGMYSLNGPIRMNNVHNVNNNFFMTNHHLSMPEPPLPRVSTYIDPFYSRPQQQEYPYSSVQLPSVMPKQEPGLLPPMETRHLDPDLIYDVETLPCEPEFSLAEIQKQFGF